MKITEAQLFEELGRTTAENSALRREVERLTAELAKMQSPINGTQLQPDASRLMAGV